MDLCWLCKEKAWSIKKHGSVLVTMNPQLQCMSHGSPGTSVLGKKSELSWSLGRSSGWCLPLEGKLTSVTGQLSGSK